MVPLALELLGLAAGGVVPVGQRVVVEDLLAHLFPHLGPRPGGRERQGDGGLEVPDLRQEARFQVLVGVARPEHVRAEQQHLGREYAQSLAQRLQLPVGRAAEREVGPQLPAMVLALVGLERLHEHGGDALVHPGPGQMGEVPVEPGDQAQSLVVGRSAELARAAVQEDAGVEGAVHAQLSHGLEERPYPRVGDPPSVRDDLHPADAQLVIAPPRLLDDDGDGLVEVTARQLGRRTEDGEGQQPIRGLGAVVGDVVVVTTDVVEVLVGELEAVLGDERSEDEGQIDPARVHARDDLAGRAVLVCSPGVGVTIEDSQLLVAGPEEIGEAQSAVPPSPSSALHQCSLTVVMILLQARKRP